VTGCHIRVRVLKSGAKRYVVRYRRGGRGFKVEHAGSFTTRRDAETRRDLVRGWLAAGRDPRVELTAMQRQPVTARTFRDAAAAYERSRLDLAATSRRSTGAHVRALNDLIGDYRLDDLDMQTLQDTVIGPLAARLKASSMSRYAVTLVLILDHAGTSPNPARTLRLPRAAKPAKRVPTARQVDRIVARLPEPLLLPVRVLAATGARVGELEQWQWGDVDLGSGRILNRAGKTASARRWIAVPPELLDELSDQVAVADRHADRPLFPGLTGNRIRGAMAAACIAAGVPHMSPHDLRHRYVSVQLARGVPGADVAAQVGHARLSMTYDVYTHVVVEDE
jgi:integrase